MAVLKVSELVRERETLKYASSLLAGLRLDKSRREPDSALAAFAELALLRIGATRTLISIFDCGYQYVVAEAIAPHEGTEPRDSAQNEHSTQKNQGCLSSPNTLDSRPQNQSLRACRHRVFAATTTERTDFTTLGTGRPRQSPSVNHSRRVAARINRLRYSPSLLYGCPHPNRKRHQYRCSLRFWVGNVRAL